MHQTPSKALELSDSEFLSALEECRLPNEMFRHVDHLRLAWMYLREAPIGAAMHRMERSIRRFAGHHDAPQKYHHTLTCVWMLLVAAAIERAPRDDDCFDDFIEANPDLADKATPLLYYSRERLDSHEARTGWQDPDLRPISATADR